jgi:hypothetical protein
MVLAEAVDAAVLEMFPRAQAPQRGDAMVEDEGTETGEAVAESRDDAGAASAPQLASADPRQASRPSAVHTRSTEVTEIPHWETTMQERGIEWDRIMEDTLQGAHLASARQSR